MHAIFDGTAVIPVLTIERLEDAVPLAEALLAGGLHLIEVTLRTAAAPAAIARIRRELPRVAVGAGTLLRAADVSVAIDAGAQFLVSPGLTPELAAAGLESELPFLPCTITPSEIMTARDLGLSLLKFFPAEPSGGIAALRHYMPVFQGVAFCPTGGITQENAAQYLALDNVPMVGSSWMASPAMIAARDWAGITEAARRAAAIKRK